MASFNKITIIGHLGRDPVLRYTPSGTAVCDFSIATSERRGSGQDAQETTTWFKINVWSKQAEVAHQYLKKGSQAYIEGRLKQSEYTTSEGEKRTTLEVNASDVQFIGARREEGDAPPQARAAAQGAPVADDDGEIPF